MSVPSRSKNTAGALIFGSLELGVGSPVLGVGSLALGVGSLALGVGSPALGVGSLALISSPETRLQFGERDCRRAEFPHSDAARPIGQLGSFHGSGARRQSQRQNGDRRIAGARDVEYLLSARRRVAG